RWDFSESTQDTARHVGGSFATLLVAQAVRKSLNVICGAGLPAIRRRSAARQTKAIPSSANPLGSGTAMLEPRAWTPTPYPTPKLGQVDPLSLTTLSPLTWHVPAERLSKANPSGVASVSTSCPLPVTLTIEMFNRKLRSHEVTTPSTSASLDRP